MSPGGRSEQVGLLRHAVARIEAAGVARFGGGAAPRMPLGRGLALDAVMRGGLSRGALHEVVAAAAGDGGAVSGFALALAIRLAADHAAPIVWIVEDAARAENGRPYAPGLRAHGLDPGRLIVVRTANGADSLWAMEEALKCRAGAVVADLWRTKAYDLVASRRLVLAAQRSGTPGLLVPGAVGTAGAISSAALSRFEVSAAPGQPLPSAGHRMPLPGHAAWGVRLARIRAGPSGGTPFDPDKVWSLAWNHEEALFCDALPLVAPAPSVDRSNPPRRAPAVERAA